MSDGIVLMFYFNKKNSIYQYKILLPNKVTIVFTKLNSK